MDRKLLNFYASLALLGFGATASAAISQSPVTGSTDGAKNIYKFLYDNYGKKTVSGVQTGDMDGASALKNQKDFAAVVEKSGKQPALVGLDLLMLTGAKETDSWYQSYTETCVSLAKELYQKGGIPAFTWHWKDPSRETEEHSTKAKFDFRTAFKSGTTEWDKESDAYKIMIKDIDAVSKVFLRLQEDGVACIWRPLHEASGAWFWWGIGTAEEYKALYKLMYDRMVKDNGVNNCLWVWNIERLNKAPYDENVLEASWYPGDEYCDFISVDVYKKANDNGSLSGYFNKIQDLMGSDKMIALSENGPIPDVNNMHKDGAVWSWWMPWYDSWGDDKFISQTSNSVWKSNMEDERVITLEDMKDWGTYKGSVVVDDPCTLNTSTHIEAECADYKGVEVGSEVCSGGKAVSVQDADGYINFEFDIPANGNYDIIIGGAIPYDAGKVCVVKLADGTSVEVAINENGPHTVGTFKLKAGKQTISVVPGWTWWVVDYMEVNPAVVQEVKPSGITDSKATASAQALYRFLNENFGKNIISGFMAGSMDGSDGTFKNHEDYKVVYTKSGKYPALGGVDFMNATGQSAYGASASWYTDYTQKSVALMENLWSLGGIPAFTWHWRDPSYETDQFYSRYEGGQLKEGDTDFDFTVAMNADGSWNENSTIYKNMIKDIDVIADFFLDMQKKGVAGIFRPLHEASGGWFWWGRQGGANYAKLYQLIHHEMVDVKGVHNLIWVWNPQSVADTDWNPGEDIYDVISIDIYNKAFDYQSNYVVFNNLKKMSGYKKLIALSENGPVVDADACVEDEAMWSWMMPWYQSWGSNFADQTSNDEWKKVMNHDKVISLDEMPGWETYTSVDQAQGNNGIIIYPNPVNDVLTVIAENALVKILDISGRTIASTTANGEEKISARGWEKGVYTAVVISDKGEKVFKIIK